MGSIRSISDHLNFGEVMTSHSSTGEVENTVTFHIYGRAVTVGELFEAHIDHEAVRQAIRDLIDSGEL